MRVEIPLLGDLGLMRCCFYLPKANLSPVLI